MKKILILTLSLIMLALVFSSCGGTAINVNFIVDGETYHTATTGDEALALPTNPQKEGFSFDGWYFDNETFEEPFSEGALMYKVLDGDVSVYAKWTDKKPYTRLDEDTILFGSYPQTEVVNEELKATLNTLSGAKPTADNAQAWTSYGYYANKKVSSFMWYIDVENGGEKYRGVYFTSSRPAYTDTTAASDSFQSTNGYFAGTVYWFKYEPISWTILKEDDDGRAMVLCDMIIDAQSYSVSSASHKEGDKTVYASNYEQSFVRSWLNDTFYNTAFDDMQKEIISVTTVNNGKGTTDSTKSNKYACANTKDKIFLLSYKDTTTYFKEDMPGQRLTSDYAQAQGAYTDNSSYKGCGYWWLRSPSSTDSDAVCGVYSGGNVSYGHVTDTTYGVVPSLWIQLD